MYSYCMIPVFKMSFVLQVLMLMALSEQCSDNRRAGVFRHVYYGFHFLLQILFGVTASLSFNCLPLSFFVSMKFLNYIHIGTFCDKMENFHNIFHFPKGAAFLQNFVVQILKLLLWFLRIISAFQTLWQNCCQSGLHIIYQNLDSSIGIHHL